MDLVLRGDPVMPGDVRAPLLSSDQPLSFWGGYDFHNGKIIDARHPLAGQVAAGKILALPFTRGSSTTTAILLESVKAGTAPAAILSSSPDSFFALASIIADEMYGSPIPLVTVTSNDFSALLHATSAHIHADGTIIVFSQTGDLNTRS